MAATNLHIHFVEDLGPGLDVQDGIAFGSFVPLVPSPEAVVGTNIAGVAETLVGLKNLLGLTTLLEGRQYLPEVMSMNQEETSGFDARAVEVVRLVVNSPMELLLAASAASGTALVLLERLIHAHHAIRLAGPTVEADREEQIARAERERAAASRARAQRTAMDFLTSELKSEGAIPKEVQRSAALALARIERAELE